MTTLRSFLVCAALTGFLAACGTGDADIDEDAGDVEVASSLFSPTADDPVIPFPNNLLFADADNMTGAVPGFATDATINLPNTSNPPNPVVTNLNLLDGFSTTDNIFLDIGGAPVDLTSANEGGIYIIDTGRGEVLSPVNDYEVVQSSVVTGRTRLLIRPLAPLAPATTYVVVVTDTLRTANGDDVLPSEEFRITADSDPVGSEDNPATGFSGAQQALLEQVRTTQVRPIFEAVLPSIPFIDAEDVILTWNFTTQSIGASLNRLAASPTPNPNGAPDGGIRVQPLPDGSGGQLSTGGVNPALADTADLFQGTVDLSYYLENNDSGASPPAPLTTFWLSDGVMAEGDSALPSPGDSPFIPCAAFSASTSTTQCFPSPAVRSVESVPVLVAVPNANSPSGGTPPAGGWPVVIFQHGITADRTNIFAIAPTLAAAGFVTVAIDIPLHGLAPGNPLRIDGLERTFDLDAMPADGVVDSSGASFINLGNPITSRDNTRQAVVDLINLNATLMAGDIPVAGGGAIDLNGNPSQFVGHSLGGIIGGVLMGVTQDTAINAATLANPGGGVIRLLDGSAAFGPTIANGLAAAGIAEGSEDYESFLRLAQTINDSADPVNYAAAANANHDLHLIEMVGGANGGSNPPDLVVPNFVVANVNTDFAAPVAGACPATADFLAFLDTVCVGAPLSGTDPLVAAMGLESVTIAPPFAAEAQPADTVVRFTSGHHSSILDPGTGSTPSGSVDPAEAAATAAQIQCQIANFLAQAAGGSPAPTIPIGAPTCP